MAELTSVVRILNGFLRIIIDAELSPSERQEVAESLRSGDLVNCLLGVLEFDNAQRAGPSPTMGVPSDGNPTLSRSVGRPKKPAKGKAGMLLPDEMFNLVRKKKISKIALLEIIERLNSGAVLGTSEDASMREIIDSFRNISSEAEWITLQRAVGGEIENDPYLSRILGR